MYRRSRTNGVRTIDTVRILRAVSRVNPVSDNRENRFSRDTIHRFRLEFSSRSPLT